MSTPPSASDFLRQAADKKYQVFSSQSRPLNLNIVGWRNKTGRTGHFDDFLAVYWTDGVRWQERTFPATTRPGIPYLLNPVNADGSGLMVPGQYMAAYALGYYKDYLALRQVRPVNAFRDPNKDSSYDERVDTIQRGLFGMHIHKASKWRNLVGYASAGCQVIEHGKDFSELIGMCSKASQYWGNKFTYTLLEF